MSISTDTVNQVKQAIDKAGEIYVLVPERMSVDVVAAALALTGSLQQAGKTVFAASPQALSEPMTSFPLANLMSTKIGNRNLVISLKVGSRDSIDKVSYNLEEDGSVFNLIIQPKKSQAPLKSEDVSFSYSGASADLVIMVGASRFEDFGPFYASERKLFSEATTISIHRYTASKFATYHLDDPRASSLSEIMYKFIEVAGLNQTKDTATVLLTGIDQTTNNLMAPTVTADTFEAVANLLRTGGIRQTYTPASAPTPVTPVIPAARPSGQVPEEWLAPKIYKSSDTGKN